MNTTFASELDRMIYKYIEILTDQHWDEEGECGIFEIEKDGYRIQLHQTLKTVFEMTALVSTENGTKGGFVEVYRRKDGKTLKCRPGDWMLPLQELASAEMLKQDREAFLAAKKRAEDKAIAFEPIVI